MKILLVEDSDDLRRTVRQALTEEGYAVDEAADGDEGAYKAEEWDYDAIILDVMLPGADGWEILRRVRLLKATPILMLTAKHKAQDRVRGLDGGADDYLVKPFDLPELLARVRALIRRSAGVASSVLVIGDVHLDTVTRRVKLDGERVELTAREYSLVEYLALQRGRVISRTTLYEHLFGEDDETTLSNLLDVYVCNVRKKLGKDFILTRRGHGYCIEGALT